MTPEEFFETCDMEGLGYALSDYFSRDSLESIKHDDLRSSALKAFDAIAEINEIREELGIEEI